MSFEIGKVVDTGEPFILSIKDVVASRTYIASETRKKMSERILRLGSCRFAVLDRFCQLLGFVRKDPP